MNLSSHVDVSIMIATLNGGRTIEKTISSIKAGESSAVSYEILIVDNGSSDGTPDLVRGIAESISAPLKVLIEPKKGKNAALNSGLPHCRGDFIIFSDDDIIFNKKWADIAKKFIIDSSGFQIFGGPITPIFQGVKNLDLIETFSNEMKGVLYAQVDQEDSNKEVRPTQIFGGNLVVRRDVFANGLKFREDTGPDGTKKYRMGSETTLLQICDSLGYRALFVNDLDVGHMISEDSMEVDWIFGRAKRYGRFVGYTNFTRNAYRNYPHLGNMPRHLIVASAKMLVLSLLHRIFGRYGEYVTLRWKAIEVWNGCLEYRSLRVAARKAAPPTA